MIKIDSRYVNCNMVEYKTKDDTYDYLSTRRNITKTGEAYSLYTVKEKDRLDLIAERMYQNATKWWIIADVNKINSPFDVLEVGSTLIIPELS